MSNSPTNEVDATSAPAVKIEQPPASTAVADVAELGSAALQLLVNGVTEFAIFMLDPQGTVTHWNAGAERIKGYRSDEIVGKHFSVFYTDEDRKADAPAHALQAAQQNGIYEAQALRVRKDGSRFMANVVIQPLHDDAGRILGFAKLTRDVSERFRQQKTLEDAKAALVQSNRLATFARVRRVAHDLNNVLHVIKNSVELLRRQVGSRDATAANLVDMVRRNADNAATLTAELFALARRRPMAASAINLNELVGGMAELLRSLLGESVTIETVLAGNLGWIAADTEQLKTAVINLVANARNASPRGGRLTIETANATRHAGAADQPNAPPPGEYVLLAVHDNGTGMTSELIAKAFDFSGTAGRAGAAELGMSQVYALMKQADGHLRVESSPASGTTIRLYFPRILDEQPGLPLDSSIAALTEAAPVASDTRNALAGLRVLVVEDESLVAILVEDLLEQLGCVVADIAPTVADGVAMASGREVDFALLDVNVGGEAVDPVAEILEARGVPFAFISGQRELAQRWLARPLVQKPFALDQLRTAIERQLGDTLG